MVSLGYRMESTQCATCPAQYQERAPVVPYIHAVATSEQGDMAVLLKGKDAMQVLRNALGDTSNPALESDFEVRQGSAMIWSRGL